MKVQAVSNTKQTVIESLEGFSKTFCGRKDFLLVI
jgi:hypothetical protein